MNPAQISTLLLQEKLEGESCANFDSVSACCRRNKKINSAQILRVFLHAAREIR